MIVERCNLGPLPGKFMKLEQPAPENWVQPPPELVTCTTLPVFVSRYGATSVGIGKNCYPFPAYRDRVFTYAKGDPIDPPETESEFDQQYYEKYMEFYEGDPGNPDDGAPNTLSPVLKGVMVNGGQYTYTIDADGVSSDPDPEDACETAQEWEDGEGSEYFTGFNGSWSAANVYALGEIEITDLPPEEEEREGTYTIGVLYESQGFVDVFKVGPAAPDAPDPPSLPPKAEWQGGTGGSVEGEQQPDPYAPPEEGVYTEADRLRQNRKEKTSWHWTLDAADIYGEEIWPTDSDGNHLTLTGALRWKIVTEERPITGMASGYVPEYGEWEETSVSYSSEEFSIDPGDLWESAVYSLAESGGSEKRVRRFAAVTAVLLKYPAATFDAPDFSGFPYADTAEI